VSILYHVGQILSSEVVHYFPHCVDEEKETDSISDALFFVGLRFELRASWLQIRVYFDLTQHFPPPHSAFSLSNQISGFGATRPDFESQTFHLPFVRLPALPLEFSISLPM
jgi:hypothetical protein